MRALSALRRTLRRNLPDGWWDVGPVADYPRETVRTVEVRGTPVAFFRLRNEFVAIGDVCPHMGASLSDGVVHEDTRVTCPAHALSFDLKTGICREDSMYSARVFPTRVRQGRVFILA